jgi:hypothetical protein
MSITANTDWAGFEQKTGKLIPFGVDANGVAFQESKPISFGEESGLMYR